MGPGVRHRYDAHRRGGETLMAVTQSGQGSRARSSSETAFKGSGQRDPRRLQGTERAAGHRAAAPAAHAPRRATRSSRTRSPSARSRAPPFESLEQYFDGTTAVAYTVDRSGGARQDADDVRQDGADADRSRRRSCRAGRSSRRKSPICASLPGKPELLRQAALRAAGADGADRQRAERRAARSDERAGAGGEETTGIVRSWLQAWLRAYSRASDS